MEEQRQRQEDEARRATVVSAAEVGVPSSTADGKRTGHQQMTPLQQSTDPWQYTDHSK